MGLFAWISQTSSGLRSVHDHDFLIDARLPDRSPDRTKAYSRDRFAAAACIDAQLDGWTGTELFGQE